MLIDDGSTDGTRAIIDSYRSKHPHIIAAHQQNGGAGCARNRGIRISTGEYITFLDSDDAITEDYCSSLHKCIEGNDLVVGGRITYLNGEFYSRQSPEAHVDTGLNSVRNVLLKRQNSYTTSAKLCRRRLFEDGNAFFPENCRYEDMGFSILSFAAAKNVAYVDKEIYRYYVRANSIITTEDERQITDYVRMVALVVDALKEKRWYDECAVEIGKFLKNRDSAHHKIDRSQRSVL